RLLALPSPPAELWNVDGPTETTVWSSAHRVSPGAGAVPVGAPLGNTSIHLAGRWGELVPPGTVGELWIGGAGLARGYHRRPDLTAERFVPDPFGDRPGRLYRTGDLARRRPDGPLEGALEVLGRIDFQVKVRGFRIELGEIEAVLGTHPAVRACVAGVLETAADDRRLVAWVVLSPETESAAEPAHLAAHLAAYLGERLPDYMVPSAFVVLPALPLNASGKVDRKALPSPERQTSEAAWHAPRTPAEEVLAGLWAELLGVPAGDRVGAGDSFFSLGGHSLLATRLIAAIRGAFGVDLPMRQVFEHPTLEGMARAIFEAGREAGEAGAAEEEPDDLDDLIVALPRTPGENRFSVSFPQLREWILDLLEPGNPAYNLPGPLRIEGPLDIPVLRAALQGLVRRHEVFRTRFVAGPEAEGGEPLQAVLPELELETPVIDLSALPEDRRNIRSNELRRQALDEAATSFDLAAAPLLRTRIVRLAAADHALLLTVHHIIADGWSRGILHRELAALYDAAVLPELPIQYADFAVWQRRRLSGAVLERQVGYWRRQLAGAPPHLALATDRPRPPMRSSRGGTIPFLLPQPLAGRLGELARRSGATLYMVLLAAFQTLLARWSGEDEVVVGTYSGNRPRRELEGLIGFFINTLVLRTSVADDPAFSELLGRVRETTLGAYAHADVPFEKLLETLAIARDPSRTPLFQALLVLHNFPPTRVELSTGVRLSSLGVASENADYDLELWLGEVPHGIAGNLVYSTALFDAATLARFAAQLQALLEAAVTDPERNVWTLPLVFPITAEGEQMLQLQAWSRGPEVPAGEPLLHRLVAEQAVRTPDAVALEGGGIRLLYAELAEQANRRARQLRAQGVGPGAIVALRAERTPDLIVSMLAVLQAGAAYLPIDPAYPQERREYMLEDSGAVGPHPLTPSPTLPPARPGEGESVLPAPPLPGEWEG
ncbi:MAG TPA: condensation domain-containing protein, partial [Thermoanaerobaculia bacterium]